MDAAQMFKAFFGNGNETGMHHAFHHHFGFGSNNASNMPGGAFFQFTQELYILTYCLVYICTIFLRFIEIQTGFFTKKKSNVCFIKIRSKHSSNTLVSLLRIFMKQTLSMYLQLILLGHNKLEYRLASVRLWSFDFEGS